MNRLILPFVTASALIFGVFLPREEAVAQNGEGSYGNVDARFHYA